MTDPMKEVELLQEIIARHERHAFSVYALLAAVLTGLAAVVFSLEKTSLAPVEVFVAGVLAVFGFGFWALAHSAVVVAAIDRVQMVEERIRGERTEQYVGPKLRDSLHGIGWRHLGRAFVYTTNYLPLLVASAVVGVILWGQYKTHRPAVSPGSAAAVVPVSVPVLESDPHALVSRFLGERFTTMASSSLGGNRGVIHATTSSQMCDFQLIRQPASAKQAWVIERYQCKPANTGPVPVQSSPPPKRHRSTKR